MAARLTILFLCVILLAQAEAASKDTWMEIDKEGRQYTLPEIPAWIGWTSEPQGTLRYKQESDGTILKTWVSQRSVPLDLETTLLIVRKDKQWPYLYGFVDHQGDMVVKPVYQIAENFHNGFSVVKIDQDASWQILDQNGKVAYTLPQDVKPTVGNTVSRDRLLPCTRGEFGGLYDLSTGTFRSFGLKRIPCYESEGLISFEDVLANKYGYADKSGQIVIPAQFSLATPFSDGLARVKKDETECYINKFGEICVRWPEKIDFGDSFYEGFAAVYIAQKQQRHPDRIYCPEHRATFGFMDKSGKIAIPLQFYSPEASWNQPRFSEGMAAVAVGNEVTYRYGYIDTTGKWIIQPQFKNALPFKNGRALVLVGKAGFDKEEWDRKGEYFRRSYQFDLFLDQYELFGMTRTQVNEILGTPNGKEPDDDFYTLHTSWCPHNACTVIIHYQNDIAIKYKYLEPDHKNEWITSATGMQQ